MKKQKNGLLLNLLLLLIVCVLFASTDGSLKVRSVALQACAPLYHGKGNAVAPLCTLSWNAAALPDILDIFETAGVSVTFAVSGTWARDNPELLSEIAILGHEIAVMGDDPMFDGGLSAVEKDIKISADAVENITGRRPKLYYSGNRALEVSSRAAQNSGLTHIQNTLDLLCAKGEAEDIVKRASESVSQGSIVLMQPTETLREALPSLIELYKTKGMDIATVSDIL